MKYNQNDIENKSDSEIFEEIEKSINAWYTYFNVNYMEGRIDKIFLNQSQWDTQESQDMQRLNIPLLTINKVNPIIRKILAEQRYLTPDLIVSPVSFYSSNDDEQNINVNKSIELRQNILRAILYDSKAKISFQIAGKNAIEGGYGAIRISQEFESPKSFNQVAKVYPVLIPEQAFFDPTSIDPTKCDGQYCGIYSILPIENFKKLYPDIKLPVSYPPVYFYDRFNWLSKEDNTITILDFYKKELILYDIHMLEDGTILNDEELDQYIKYAKSEKFSIPAVIQTRKCEDYKIYHYRAIYNTILERKVFPGKNLPIIFVDGDSYYVDGIQRTQSMVKWAKDPQRVLNYFNITIANLFKNMRKEKFMGTDAMFAGKEYIWARPDIFQGALRYNWDPQAGGKPDIISPSEIPQTLIQQYNRAAEDIQSSIGYYDANLGAPTSEISGSAISKKILQGNNSMGIYNDNLIRGIEQAGRTILGMIPYLYDTTRQVPVKLSDGRTQHVMINTIDSDGNSINNLKNGEYDVIVKAAPSYESQKEMTLNLLLKLASINPKEVFPMVADLIADNLTVANRQQLVERLRNLVPPPILAKEEGKPPPPPPPPQQPDPKTMEKMAALQTREHELKIREQDQVLAVIEMLLHNKEKLNDNEIQTLKTIADMYRTEMDNKTKRGDTYSKSFGIMSNALK
ncbi:MAG: portal protein [Candidatus Thorarchaeota archaeon]